MWSKLTMAALVTSLALSGACASDGTPVAGGNAYFTAPGSASVAVTPWKDRDATAALPQPVPLDAAGRAQVFLAQPADIRVEDSQGITVATYKETGGTAGRLEVLNAGFTGTDPVSGSQLPGGRTTMDTVLSNLYASLGGTDGTFLAAPTATKRTLKSKFLEVQVSVKDFGAVGNGAADDTTAIQATINYVAALGGGVVYFPPGTYLTSAAITTGASNIFIVGAGMGATTIKMGNGAASAIVQGAGAYRMFFRDILFTSTGGSSGSAILVNTTRSTYLDRVYVDGFATAVSNSVGGTLYLTSSLLTGTTSAVVSTGSVLALSTSFTGATGYGLSVTGIAGVQVNASLCTFSGATAGLNIGENIALFASSSTAGFGAPGLVIAAGAGEFLSSACDWGSVTDGRVAAPVAYSFAADGNFTPLPLQTDAIRVVATAAATVTVNAIATTGFGRKWSLTCSRTTASAVTWTFNAQYVLSAAVAPANGNRVNLLLEYNPVDNKVYEIGRGATSN